MTIRLLWLGGHSYKNWSEKREAQHVSSVHSLLAYSLSHISCASELAGLGAGGGGIEISTGADLPTSSS